MLLLYLVDILSVGYVQGSCMFREEIVHFAMASFWKFSTFSDPNESLIMISNISRFAIILVFSQHQMYPARRTWSVHGV